MSGTAWTVPHNWGTAEPIYSAFLNQTVQDAHHLKQTNDVQGTASGTAVVGQIVVQTGTAGRLAQTTAAGQAGPAYAVLEPLNGGTAAYVRLQGSVDVYAGATVTPGQFLQASASSGTVQPTADYTSAVAVALGSAGPGTLVAAQLLAWPSGRLAGTPAFTLGTANSPGTAGQFVRTDATLALSGSVAVTNIPVLTKVYSSVGSTSNPTTTSATLVNLDGNGAGTVLRVDGTCAPDSSGTLLCWVQGAFQNANTFTMGLGLNFNGAGGVTYGQAHAPFAGGQANIAAPHTFVGTAGSAFSVVAMWNTSGGTATAVNTARNLVVMEVIR